MLALSTALHERLESSQPLAPVAVLRLDWPDASRRYADRACRIDGSPLAAGMWRLERWRAEAGDFAASPPRLPRFEATARLADLAEDELERFAELAGFFDATAVGGSLSLGFAASGPSTSGGTIELESDDLAVLSPVVVRAWRREGVDVVLTLLDPISAAGERIAAPSFDPSAAAPFPFPRIPTKRWPLVFGRALEHKLEPYRFGAIATLAEDCFPRDEFLVLDGVDGFPPAGFAQVGGEVVEYDDVGAFAKRLGSALRPLDRPNAVFHSAGEPVYAVPPGGFAWLVAAHAIEEVVEARSRAGAIAESDWGEETEERAGRSLSLVAMDALPTIESGAEGPRTLRVDERTVGAQWAVGPFNTALNPEGALAYDDAADVATLKILENVLDLRMDALPKAGAGFGPAARARIVVEYAASMSWLPESKFVIGASDDVQAVYREVPRPPDVERTAKLGAETIKLPVALRRFAFDATTFFGEDWGRLEQPHVLFAQLLHAGLEAVEIQIAALYWEVEAERPPRLVPQTALTAEVLGWANGEGAAIERPAALAASLLAADEGFDLAPSLIDDANLAALDAAEEAAGLRVARVVEDGASLARLLAELIAQGGLELLAEGAAWRLRRAPAALALEEPAASLKPSMIYSSAAPSMASEAPDGGGAGARRVFFGERMGGVGYAAVATSALGFVEAESTARAAEARWLPADQLSAAAALGARMLDSDARPLETVSVEAAWAALGEAWPGEAASLRLASGAATLPCVALSAEGGAALGGRARDGFAIVLRALAPERSCWSDGAGQRVAQHANQAIHFFIAGELVATLRGDGAFLLRGRPSEGIALPAATEAIEWNAGAGLLLFSAVDGATVAPVFGLDASGNLRLAAALRERQGTSLGTRSECVLAESGEIALSLSGGRTLLVGDAATSALLLAGSVREAAPI